MNDTDRILEYSEAAMKVKKFNIEISLWNIWMLISILSLFTSVWLMLLSILHWSAIILTFYLLVMGLIAKPRYFLRTGATENDKQEWIEFLKDCEKKSGTPKR